MACRLTDHANGRLKYSNGILNELEQMPVSKQQQVLDYAVSLRSSRPKGTPGKELLKFAGTISREDCELMQGAIEEAFEKVDPNEW